MTDISRSPEINTFQRDAHIRNAEEKGEEPSESYIKMWDDWRNDDLIREANPEWQKDNLEYDLRSTDWILAKARASDKYAQNIYAALCNMQWQKIDVMPILKDQYWSCSWRHAGGIVANILQKGDYIDWYCSGIGSGLGNGDEDGSKGYVGEGHVTEEIKEDFKRLGWQPQEWELDD